ncbi:hypothetical protein PGRAN_06406 [Listeria grandensis FSL F6-0971]|uniref:Uncharacterized protein n=1 Tax=Listeria grandensis FSL F6-0971 TaxID=1265819 RepID=W7BDF5_9LIST|nr:hypothetical protein [Listeria grandensis]EUJ23967.1 hypothetical protein PGRAN_06406 [Listeria grandensis FSL F6-0971]
MKKGLSRLLLVTIAITMIVSTIPAYEPYAEQGVPPAEGTIEGASEKATIKTVNSKQWGYNAAGKQVASRYTTK